MEEWRPISGWPGYEVSNLGRVRSWKWPSKNRQWVEDRTRKPRLIIKGTERPEKGYVRAQLCDKEHGLKKESVHVLVLQAFVGPRPSDDHQGTHWDGNKFNNQLGNLRWATRKENAADKKRHGTHLNGENITTSKLTREQVDEIRERKETIMSYARRFKVHKNTINNVLHEVTWRD